MPHLTARYEAELPSPVLLQADRMTSAKFKEPVFDDGRLRFKAVIGGFDVVLTIHTHGGGWTQLPDGTALVGAYECVVEVSREELEEVPEVVTNASGGRDFTPRSPYFQRRAAEYSAATRTCLERFLAYVRFELGQPLIWGAGDSPPHVIKCTTWLDAVGDEINPGFQALGATMTGSRHIRWRAEPLRGPDEMSLRNALEVPTTVPLHRLIAAQGKDAALEGDLRRAVMELAIASEIAVKQAFFAPESAAGEAFEYFEEKKLVRAAVVDLLKEPSRRAFGEAFSDAHSDAFEQVEYLFRCRNKVVHRGKLTFRDRSGAPQPVDRTTLRDWVDAVHCLFEWLEAKAELSPAA